MESGAAIGLAFDGDGDRLIAVDEKGNEITGDQVLIICANMLKKDGKLKNDLLVTTVMSNLGLRVACKKYGFKHHASKVGDRYVLEDMLSMGAIIGGEEAGHMIFLDHHTTGDGIIAAMQLIAAMVREGKPLSEMAAMMDIFPQKLINVDVQAQTGHRHGPAAHGGHPAGGKRTGRRGTRAGPLFRHPEHVPRDGGGAVRSGDGKVLQADCRCRDQRTRLIDQKRLIREWKRAG